MIGHRLIDVGAELPVSTIAKSIQLAAVSHESAVAVAAAHRQKLKQKCIHSPSEYETMPSNTVKI
jgi:hypothetical protein